MVVGQGQLQLEVPEVRQAHRALLVVMDLRMLVATVVARGVLVLPLFLEIRGVLVGRVPVVRVVRLPLVKVAVAVAVDALVVPVAVVQPRLALAVEQAVAVAVAVL